MYMTDMPLGCMNNMYGMIPPVYQSVFPVVGVPMNSFPMMGVMSNNMLYNPYQMNGNDQAVFGMNINDSSQNYDTKLAEFMALPIDKVVDDIDIYIIDQDNCKFAQDRLEREPNTEFYEKIFDRIIYKFNAHTKDQFANYFCQKIVDKASENKLNQIVSQLLPDIVEIAKSPHGTRVLQKIIEKVKQDEVIESILTPLKGEVRDLVNNTNGNHVIQKCLANMGCVKTDFIYKEIANHCKEIGTHKHGCCVLQRCYDHSSDDQKELLTERIIQFTNVLVRDQYGNYVIQFVLNLDGFSAEKNKIGFCIKDDLLELSKQKFSSNVIEKCIEIDLDCIISSLVSLLSNEKTLIELFSDNFGNYVIQRILKKYEGADKVIPVVNCIRDHLANIKIHDISSKVLSRLPKSYEFGEAQEQPVGLQGKRTSGNTQTPSPLYVIQSKPLNGNDMGNQNQNHQTMYQQNRQNHPQQKHRDHTDKMTPGGSRHQNYHQNQQQSNTNTNYTNNNNYNSHNHQLNHQNSGGSSGYHGNSHHGSGHHGGYNNNHTDKHHGSHSNHGGHHGGGGNTNHNSHMITGNYHHRGGYHDNNNNNHHGSGHHGYNHNSNYHGNNNNNYHDSSNNNSHVGSYNNHGYNNSSHGSNNNKSYNKPNKLGNNFRRDNNYNNKRGYINKNQMGSGGAYYQHNNKQNRDQQQDTEQQLTLLNQKINKQQQGNQQLNKPSNNANSENNNSNSNGSDNNSPNNQNREQQLDNNISMYPMAMNQNGNNMIQGVSNQNYPVNMNMNLNFNVNQNYPNLAALSLQDKKDGDDKDAGSIQSIPNNNNDGMSNNDMKWN